jgi:hypothetical protein
MFLLLHIRFLIMQQLGYNNGNGVYMWSVPRSYLEENQGDPVGSVEFCKGGCEERA